MNKISAVYQIENIITGDKYVGSSKNVKNRWAAHKCISTWKECPNSPLYQDFQKYGLDKFRFQILAPVKPEHLKEVEQEFIEKIQPAYNDRNANGWDVERRKKYYQSEKYKEYQKEYDQSEKGKERYKKYQQSEKGKEIKKKYNQSKKGKKAQKKYFSQLCSYEGEKLTLGALRQRFKRAGVEHAAIEAKKYLLEGK